MKTPKKMRNKLRGAHGALSKVFQVWMNWLVFILGGKWLSAFANRKTGRSLDNTLANLSGDFKDGYVFTEIHLSSHEMTMYRKDMEEIYGAAFTNVFNEVLDNGKSIRVGHLLLMNLHATRTFYNVPELFPSLTTDISQWPDFTSKDHEGFAITLITESKSNTVKKIISVTGLNNIVKI